MEDISWPTGHQTESAVRRPLEAKGRNSKNKALFDDQYPRARGSEVDFFPYPSTGSYPRWLATSSKSR